MAKKESKNVLVDDKKKLRAQEIVDLLEREPRNEEEETLKEKFTALVSQDEVADADLLEYVYTKLGGLVRTPAEQEVAKKKEAEIKAKFNKNKDKYRDEELE